MPLFDFAVVVCRLMAVYFAAIVTVQLFTQLVWAIVSAIAMADNLSVGFGGTVPELWWLIGGAVVLILQIGVNAVIAVGLWRYAPKIAGYVTAQRYGTGQPFAATVADAPITAGTAPIPTAKPDTATVLPHVPRRMADVPRRQSFWVALALMILGVFLIVHALPNLLTIVAVTAFGYNPITDLGIEWFPDRLGHLIPLIVGIVLVRWPRQIAVYLRRQSRHRILPR